MLTQEQVVQAAMENGFEDIGFTTAEPFESQLEFLSSHQKEYGWAEKVGLSLLDGCDPKSVLPEAKTIIVLMEVYYREKYPRVMEGHFGRCYLDDDRVTKDGLSRRIKAFRSFLRDHGIDSKVPFNIPHRMAAARAGMGSFGKNCLFYSNRVARHSSWILPIAVVIDREFTPGTPSIENGCPDWCRNACIAACPTRALKSNGTIDPRRCVSYLSYFGDGLTPIELREPMGLYVYGCDRCQNVCPRNAAWLAADLPTSSRVAAKAPLFELEKLLAMDTDWFMSHIWPHMFYMSADDLWRWKMNVARAMGNTRDPRYIPALTRALAQKEEDDRVRAMAAWALGRLGGPDAIAALDATAAVAPDLLAGEIDMALSALRP
jgi:epoxyqueuosine reductase